MNKLVLSKTLILSACLIGLAQTTQVDKYVWEKKDDGKYGCKYDGDGGHLDVVEKGKIVKVVDGNTVIFKGEKNRERKVNLIAVDPDSNETTVKEFLKSKVLNKEAELIYSSSQWDSKKVNGIVEIDGKDINRLALELGLAIYKDSKIYQISFFNDCVYFRAEQKARNDKLGIWAQERVK